MTKKDLVEKQPEKSEKKPRGRPFKKGVSGNPKGRPPKGTALSEVLRERADAVKLADTLLKLAYGGDITALKAVYDRIDGRARESIDLSANGDLELKLTSILGDKK